ncbi:MAG: hypothetical protein AAF493_01565 [Pseudomonadota bacterium]
MTPQRQFRIAAIKPHSLDEIWRHDSTDVRAQCFRLMLAVLLMLLAVFAGALWMDSSAATRFMREDGPVETATVALYGLCLALMFLRGGMSYLRKHWYAATLVLVLALRELDLHKEFTTMGIFRTRFFLSDKVPAAEKLIGALVIIAILAVLIIAVRRHWRRWWQGLRQLNPIAVGITVAVLLGVLSKTLDGSKRKLESIGLDVTDMLQERLFLVEETLELGIPCFLLIALHAYLKRPAPKPEVPRVPVASEGD